MRKFFYLLLGICTFWTSLIAQTPPQFGARQTLGILENKEIDEASGIGASRRNPDVFWTHNDSGGENRLFAFNRQGTHLGTYYLDGAENRDWEDIAVGPGPEDDVSYIFVADIGDNDGEHDMNYVYRVPEPLVGSEQVPVVLELDAVDRLAYQYPDGPRDAETLMVDPLTRDWVIVSKREENVQVYRAPFPQDVERTMVLEYVTYLPVTQIVGGDISIDGTEIILKNYLEMYYFQRRNATSIGTALLAPPVTVPYFLEPQGEGVCWENKTAGGYFTLSEERYNIPAALYFYPRLTTAIPGNGTPGPPSPFISFQNYPNPFNSVTTICFELREAAKVSAAIFNITGKKYGVRHRHRCLPGNTTINGMAEILNNKWSRAAITGLSCRV
ncbi:hypothetical protein KAH55_14295, partial [bacterium]|nr:hypothetical protein [bacterium]